MRPPRGGRLCERLDEDAAGIRNIRRPRTWPGAAHDSPEVHAPSERKCVDTLQRGGDLEPCTVPWNFDDRFVSGEAEPVAESVNLGSKAIEHFVVSRAPRSFHGITGTHRAAPDASAHCGIRSATHAAKQGDGPAVVGVVKLRWWLVWVLRAIWIISVHHAMRLPTGARVLVTQERHVQANPCGVVFVERTHHLRIGIAVREEPNARRPVFSHHLPRSIRSLTGNNDSPWPCKRFSALSAAQHMPERQSPSCLLVMGGLVEHVSQRHDDPMRPGPVIEELVRHGVVRVVVLHNRLKLSCCRLIERKLQISQGSRQILTMKHCDQTRSA